MPYVERKVASGTARGEDRLWYAESFLRAGKPTEAVAAVQDDPYGLCKLARRFAELGHPLLADAARAKARALFEDKRAKEPENPAWAAELAQLLLDSGHARSGSAPGDSLFRRPEGHGPRPDGGRPPGLVRAGPGVRRHPAAGPRVRQGHQRFGDGRAHGQGVQHPAVRRQGGTRGGAGVARTGVKLDRREWTLLSLGMAECRSGNCTAADKALLAAAEAGKNTAWVPGISAFYRAMSLFRAGPARRGPPTGGRGRDEDETFTRRRAEPDGRRCHV